MHILQARRMNHDPARDPLAVQVRQRRLFYEEYLLPRIRQFCESKGALLWMWMCVCEREEVCVCVKACVCLPFCLRVWQACTT